MYAYQYFQKNRERGGALTYPLSEDTSERLFDLYLGGVPLDQIQRVNKQFGLGQIATAAVEGQWELRRRVYQLQLNSRSADTAKQVVQESAEFIGLAMRASHKMHGEALKRYIASGDPKDLGAFGVGGVGQYKALLEILMKVTGQDQVKKVVGSVTHHHTVDDVTIPVGGSLQEMAARKKALERAGVGGK